MATLPLRIDDDMSAVAYHITDGATRFPYHVDAQSAISRHPLEWSSAPWSREDADAARSALDERYQADVADAQARNLPAPAPPPPPPAPLTPEDQAAIDEHAKAVAEAKERLDKYYAKKAEEKAIADAVAADEALVKSAPPEPQPQRRLTAAQIRAKAAELSPAEQAEVDKQRAADEKAVTGKQNADALAGNTLNQPPAAPLKPNSIV